MNDVSTTTKKIIANVEKVIVGKRRQIVLSLVSWFCGGHVLLEDVPGVAKTMLARAMARSVGCSFKRIQCTPDLLPTDVTGVSVFNQKTHRVRVPPRPDLRPGGAGRRDQPGHAADPGRLAGGDGRGPRHRGRHDPRAAAAVLGHRHAEPHRPRRHLPAARGPARPLPGPFQPGVSEHGGRAQDARTVGARQSAGPIGAGRHAPRSCWPPSRRCGRSTSIRRFAATSPRSSKTREAATT